MAQSNSGSEAWQTTMEVSGRPRHTAVSMSEDEILSIIRQYQSKARPQTWDEPRFQTAKVGSTGKGVLIGLLSALGAALLITLILALIYFFRYTSRGKILLDRMGRPGEYDDEQAFAKEEADALEHMDDLQRHEYLRAKAFVEGNPPESAETDISLSQFLAIQEKGVSAWEFEPELEIANCFVEGRTEIEFFDSECSVQSNLPVPKQNEVYYWEAKIYDKPETTTIGIGMTTKPYPLFRMPGLHRTSVSYTSPGHRRFNQPFTPALNYAPPYVRGDVVGCGYRPRTGTVFFTRNGKKLDDVTHTLKTQNLFPTVGATGPCSVHVNFGHMGFVFIEANVKKWGLAPMTGSLAPPPPYGSEAGSILLEGGHQGIPEGQGWLSGSSGTIGPSSAGPAGWSGSPSRSHARTRSAQVRLARQQPTSPGPQRSPTDISLTQLSLIDDEETDAQAGLDVGEGASHTEPHQSVLPQEIGHYSDAGLEPPPPDYESPESDDDATSHHQKSRAPAGRDRRYRDADSNDDDDEEADEEADDDDEEGDRTSTPRPGTAQRLRQETHAEDEYDEVPEDQRRLLQPPPRTSSRRHARSNSGSGGSSSHANEPPSPPIPSYDVAVSSKSGESRRQG